MAPMHVFDQLRSNLRAQAVPFTEHDLEGIAAKAFLDRVVAFEQLLDGVPPDSLPDYLVADALPTAGLPPVANGALPSQAPIDTIAGVAPLLQSRQLSPLELVEQALERIAARDGDLNAFQLVLDEQARADARRAEEELAAGEYRGPLHGVPLAVKDILDLVGTPTTAGAKVRASQVARTDAAAVERLRAAGAVIVGKTRMSEFAYSPGSNNAHYGATRNPFHLEHDAGGSSSGSGAAVATGMAFAALGTDTGGSIRIPAALCGIVGLKPTFGRCSLAGAVNLSWSLDHLGPLARSVADAAIMLTVLAGYDARDPRTRRDVPPANLPDLSTSVAGLRIGLLNDDGTDQPLASDEIQAAGRQALAGLEAAGAQVEELALPELDGLRLLNGAILAMEAAAYHLPLLRSQLDELSPFFRQRILAAFAYGPGSFVRAQQARAQLRRRCARMFERIDLLALPCQPAPAPALGTPAPTSFTGPFNLLGWPALSLPVGLNSDGLPLALQLVGRPWDEATLLRAAHAAEQAVGRIVHAE